MALAANRVNMKGKIEGRDIDVAIKNGVTIFEGGLTCVDDNGALPGTSATASLRWGGVCIRSDGVGNAGGTKRAILRRRGTQVFKKAAATAADLLKLAYVSDDETVVVAAPGNNYIAGRIVGIVDSGNVEIDLEDRVA